MTWIDITILVIIAGLIIHGIIMGLIRGVFDIVGIILGFFLAINYHGAIRFPKFLSFLLIFVITVIVFSILGRIISKLIHVTPLGILDRILGGILGMVKGLVVCLSFRLILLLLKTANRTMHVSKIAPTMLRWGLTASQVLPRKWHDWIEEVITHRQLVFNDEDHHLSF